MADPLNTSRFYFSAALQAKLNVAQTKSAWGGLVKGDLGSSRVVKITRYASAQAAADKTGGTVLRSATNTGALAISGGDLSGLGTISSVTINQAVDFSSGFHVLSFETPGGVEMRGAIGLSPMAQVKAGAAAGSVISYVFTAEENLDAAKGFLLGQINIYAPRLMPSGIGPKAPEITASAPVTARLWDWSNPAAPVMVDSATFSERLDDFTLEDPIMASEYGDVRVDIMSKTLKLGKFQFGFIRYTSDKSLTIDGGPDPLYQVRVNISPWDRPWWTNGKYPAMSGFSRSTDITQPPPFKIDFLDGNGQIFVGVEGNAIQMSDGLAVNDRTLNQTDESKGIRPWVNIGDLLQMNSKRVKQSIHCGKWFNGMTDFSIRPSVGKRHYSVNPSFPMISAYDQYNGAFNLYNSPRWPMGNKYIPAYDDLTFQEDSYAWNPVQISGGTNHHLSGWDTEPGAISNHDQYTGKGGPRFDRCCVPSAYAMFVSNPTGRRLAGNVSWRDIAEGWTGGYLYRGDHFFPDRRKWTSVANGDAGWGKWSYLEGYYYANGIFPDVGADRTIDFVIAGNGSVYGPGQRTSEGVPFFKGNSIDALHAYRQEGWRSLIFTDPAMAATSKHNYFALWMASMGGRGPTREYNFMVRTGAWRFLAYAMAWKLGTKHSIGMTRGEVEARFQLELEQIWSDIYKPVVIDNEQSIRGKVFRVFGTGHALFEASSTDPAKPANEAVIASLGGNIAMYLGHAMILLKLFGLYDVMRAKNERLAQLLPWIVQCCDKQCVDMIAVTNGKCMTEWNEYCNYVYVPKRGSEITVADIPDSWEDWETRRQVWDAARGDISKVTYVHRADGSPTKGDSAGCHLLVQWAMARKWAFKEVENPNIAIAVSKLEAMFEARRAYIDSLPNAKAKGEADFVYLVPGHGVLKEPTA